MSKPPNLIKNHDGQTAVEYILMLVIVFAMMIVVLKDLKSRFLSENGECTGPKAKSSVICQLDKIISREGGFRRFSLLGHNSQQ